MIYFLPRIGHKGSCEREFLGMNEGFKSNIETLLTKTAIIASDGFEKVACSLKLSEGPVYGGYIVKQARIVSCPTACKGRYYTQLAKLRSLRSSLPGYSH